MHALPTVLRPLPPADISRERHDSITTATSRFVFSTYGTTISKKRGAFNRSLTTRQRRDLLDDAVLVATRVPTSSHLACCKRTSLFPADNLPSFRDSSFNYLRMTSRRSLSKRSRQVIVLQTRVRRIAKRDVRARDTWWAQVTQTPVPPPTDAEVSGCASAAPPVSPPPVFPSRSVRYLLFQPSPLRILVVGTTRRGLFRRS